MGDRLSTEELHDRYLAQSRWTEQLRHFIYEQIKVTPTSKILEVGCGTGVITKELHSDFSDQVFGIDISFSSLQNAKLEEIQVNYSSADANYLPYAQGFFDFVICHYFLLWISDPVHVLKEISRVLKSGGIFAALAEPDFSSRVDFPAEFEKLGTLQRISLINLGADPDIGKKLPHLLAQSGFLDIQYGASGFQINPRALPESWNSEWKVLRSDLSNTLTPTDLDYYQDKDRESRNNGERVMWVPTFYAFGKNRNNHK